MRLICIAFSIFLTGLVSAGEQTYTEVKLGKDISIIFIVGEFIKAENNVVDCGGYICLINDKPLWGADGKLPNSMLKKMLVNIKGRKVELDTSGMFNPLVSAIEKNKYKVINYYDDMWKVRGEFSDGSATYYAEWLVANGHATRIVIGDSELLYDAFDHIFKKK